MEKTLSATFWSIQINLVVWFLVFTMATFMTHPRKQDFLLGGLVVGLCVASVLQYIALHHLRPLRRAPMGGTEAEADAKTLAETRSRVS